MEEDEQGLSQVEKNLLNPEPGRISRHFLKGTKQERDSKNRIVIARSRRLGRMNKELVLMRTKSLFFFLSEWLLCL